ncbi:hypothetical protein YC2023_042591 [Brassica napus]
MSTPPEILYNDSEARKYTFSSRIVEIQARLSERALKLLALPEDDVPRFLLDIGKTLLWNEKLREISYLVTWGRFVCLSPGTPTRRIVASCSDYNADHNDLCDDKTMLKMQREQRKHADKENRERRGRVFWTTEKPIKITDRTVLYKLRITDIVNNKFDKITPKIKKKMIQLQRRDIISFFNSKYVP